MTHEGLLDGVENMRRDVEMLTAAEAGTFGARIYGWNGPWVSVGRFQTVVTDLVDLDRLNWIRRPTGGKAVLHGHDLTVSISLPLAMIDGSVRRSVRSMYRIVVKPVIFALQAVGVKAVLAADSVYANVGVRSGDCFAFSSPNDVVDAATGKKLCGCALRLTGSAVLLQASIPVTPPLVCPETVIRAARPIEPTPIDEVSFSTAFCASLKSDWIHP